MLDQHYEPKQAAELLGVDAEQVLGWIHAGEIVAADVSKQNSKRPRWRISESELGRFLLRRRHPAAGSPQPKPTRLPQPKQYV